MQTCMVDWQVYNLGVSDDESELLLWDGYRQSLNFANCTSKPNFFRFLGHLRDLECRPANITDAQDFTGDETSKLLVNGEGAFVFLRKTDGIIFGGLIRTTTVWSRGYSYQRPFVVPGWALQIPKQQFRMSAIKWSAIEGIQLTMHVPHFDGASCGGPGCYGCTFQCTIRQHPKHGGCDMVIDSVNTHLRSRIVLSPNAQHDQSYAIPAIARKRQIWDGATNHGCKRQCQWTDEMGSFMVASAMDMNE
mmetsp:Transcript_101283/g.174912  ORF Transcript_101283/g.174912 Transcript_101283/m.174912 type:complete len:248 (-) Transcript_101283:334-1077(-)